MHTFVCVLGMRAVTRDDLRPKSVPCKGRAEKDFPIKESPQLLRRGRVDKVALITRTMADGGTQSGTGRQYALDRLHCSLQQGAGTVGLC